MTRRGFLGCSLAAAAVLPASSALAAGRTGSSREGANAFVPFDEEIQQFMSARQIPGGALAVVKDSRLVYVRAYGWANREQRQATTVRSLFRIASVSKPITAATVLKLVENGRMDLEAKAFAAWPASALASASGAGSTRDPRLADITVRQLLQHTGGWDREVSFDPMFRPVEIARSVGRPAPAGPREIIQYMLGRPLDFDPGSRFAYSNFGYCVLGRLIEQATGRSYETAVRKTVFEPCGIRAMRLGASLERRRAPGEVRYYMSDPGRVESVFRDAPGTVPEPYGGFHLEAMDAHGGWIASVVDLARFAAAMQNPGRASWLKPSSIATLSAPPPAPAWRGPGGQLEAAYYGCGWMVRPDAVSGRPNLWHSGSLPGTSSLLVLRRDGLAWVAVFNQRASGSQRPDSELDPALHRAAGKVESWPAHDLFSSIE